MKETEISTLGEFGLIEHLTRSFPVRNESTRRGVGDDCAVINYGNNHSFGSGDYCLSKDTKQLLVTDRDVPENL